jgi:hypothetical protein
MGLGGLLGAAAVGQQALTTQAANESREPTGTK